MKDEQLEVDVMMGWYGGAGWMMIGMAGFWLLVIGVLAWAIVRVFPRQPRVGEDPRQILDRRFASGEIDEATYRASVDVLNVPHRR
ncbi:SHOCT domain-containing protein [Rhodococcus sp. WAY2]|uniref:SHOCT domain-containing protein n=1 Tax=Rhodococcus sp. WAY2 TaxID=2663121 RepID=UPI00132052C4|nr:SHOCT domain-containing protein [Rhodococcus sp. WAY2]QHE74319.1 hypothetical protein GFS60_08017 [Rhodococcus sp. WAY2]